MDIKAMGSKHGDKLALGAAALLFIGYFVYNSVFSGENPELGAVISGAKQIEGQIGDSNSPPPLPALTHSAALQGSWKDLVTPEPANNWVAYHPTKFEPKFVESIKPKDIILLTPTLGEPTVDLGKISFSWQDHPNSSAGTSGYEVARKGGPDKDWRVLTSEPVEGTSYDDQDVQPKTSYTYRIRALTDDKKAKSKTSDWSNEITATAKGVIELSLKIASSDLASIEVRKYLRGKWETKTYSVKKGDKIGIIEKRPEGGKVVTIDMTTGYTLLDILQGKQKRKQKKVSTVMEDGVPIRKEEEVEVEINEWKIVYKDDEGKKNEIWRQAPEGK